MSSTHSKLIGPWLQLVAFLLAAIASLSRISDHRHHPVDVLAGAIVGVGVGLLTAISVLSKRSSETEEEEEGKKRKSKGFMRGRKEKIRGLLSWPKE